jgi:hypothetical protein
MFFVPRKCRNFLIFPPKMFSVKFGIIAMSMRGWISISRGDTTPLSVCEKSLANAAAAHNLARIFHGKKPVEFPFNATSSDFRCDIDSVWPLLFLSNLLLPPRF